MLATTAQGAATVTLDDVSGLLSWNITFGNNGPSFNNGMLDNGAEVLAHFHGPAMPGMTAGVQVTLPLGSPKIGSQVISALQQTQVKSDLWYINIHSTSCGAGEIRGQVVRTPTCGDGIVDGPGEQCDDGNNTNGDCCSSTCQNEADGNSCQTFGTCTSGQCILPNHYACYQVKHKLTKGQTGSISNQVEAAGTFQKCKLKYLCAPTSKTYNMVTSPIQNPALHYCCHQCKGGKPAVPYTITDQFVTGAVTTKKLKLICNPCVKAP